MPTVRLAYAEAYERKTELGGGFRGAAINSLTGEKYQSEVRQTIEEARNDAKKAVWAWADGRNMVTGTYRNRRNTWRMNYFIRCDEVTEAEQAAFTNRES
jgi:hypothetical protein